jgi:PncC family amidohydrolase
MPNNAADVLGLLEKKGLTLGSVESLTGGLFASTICSIPGASKVFMGALVTYDNKEKVNLAGVRQATILKKGVVSQEVADEMALGGLVALGVDVCVSFTGNAGPTVEPGGAVVGQVYMALAFKGKEKTLQIPLILKGDRNEIRQQCVDLALTKILANV